MSLVTSGIEYDIFRYDDNVRFIKQAPSPRPAPPRPAPPRPAPPLPSPPRPALSTLSCLCGLCAFCTESIQRLSGAAAGDGGVAAQTRRVVARPPPLGRLMDAKAARYPLPLRWPPPPSRLLPFPPTHTNARSQAHTTLACTHPRAHIHKHTLRSRAHTHAHTCATLRSIAGSIQSAALTGGVPRATA